MTARALISRVADSAYARVDGQSISAAQFIADILTCAEALPDARHTINLCVDRYQFSVAFFAAAVRGQINLLPTSRDAQSVTSLRDQFHRVSLVADHSYLQQPHCAAPDQVLDLVPGAQGRAESPSLADDAVIAIAFTSGSTGAPQAHHKVWALLNQGRHTHQRYLPGSQHQPRGLVATVPCWHMYGLEWALLLPTVAPLELFCGNDFFPQDVRSALAGFADPAVLIATPVHLRALLKSPAPPRPVDTTVCATAPLSTALATAVEQHLGTRLFEIYGCSEIGSLACRATATQSSWEFFDDFGLQLQDQILSVASPLLNAPVALADRFAATDDGRYRLLGRASDIVKVAGKRESLAHLNLIATSIEGVEDAAFYQPEQFGLPETGRLGLVAVAPQLSAAALKRALAAQLDRTFLPRPIHLVEALPREASSKLSRAALGQLLAELAGISIASS